ncbi:hypothetical protein K9N68_30960 [Kovacikia minuta CCNUW1]|uniref:alpha/beta hydrolase n=1 Tax=Kovacikia minuta TaxID=2931930 RepID=UPI001CCFF990|nr:hypothetical protein [Kovacikia minuta]UBF25911.1 hypothetical protein K9N68_30960 [Kovacikia minuta CCNUW1]
MLVFFIHGVNTPNCKYADTLIRNIKNNVRTPANFYSSFWGNLFINKKYQVIECIEKDFSRACEKHKEYKEYHFDIYRYKRRRNELVNSFLGDFLIYQNPERGKAIRKVICEQLKQFLDDHPEQTKIHFIAHSLGSLILWDLLFSSTLPKDDPAFIFRKYLNDINLESISTLGSPLLFLKQMLDIDFSIVNRALEEVYKKNFIESHKLRWVNIIHSSDLIAPIQI